MWWFAVQVWIGCAAYHPDGYEDPAVHGPDLKLHAGVDGQGGDCRDCHGDDLVSGDAGACSDCHQDGWDTSCTYCHGDAEDGTGAPPRDLDGATDADGMSFPAHRAHVSEGRWHGDYDCTSCHTKPTDALWPGHVFDDDTPGRAELYFVDGGSFDEDAGTCRVACHGDGTGDKGKVAVDAAAATCDSCHDTPPPTGEHTEHLLHGLTCAECHPDVNDDGTDIPRPAKHVDGAVDVALPGGMTFTAADSSCDGVCHNETHTNRHW